MTRPAHTRIDRLRALYLSGAPREPAPDRRAPAAIPGRPERIAGGTVHVADWSTPRTHAHGRAVIDANQARLPLPAAAASRDPRFRDIDPASWLFIDTETTSLNSGAGVWVFMVGLGWFERDAFRIRQFLLADPGGERALLAAVHGRLEAAGAIVSFHGKSFDAPRLDDRFRLAGLEAAISGRPHLDLLHPLRRLHGERLADCRLRTMEEEILGFRRTDDLPGALCPEAYFAYLRGRPHRLADVFEHNRLDVLSLTALSGHLPDAYEGACTRASALRAGLDWAEAGECERARAFLLAWSRLESRAPVTVALAAARWLRRLGQEPEAREVLAGMVAREPQDPRPALALKRLERRMSRAQAAGAPA
jgi:uncharacterized protein YprB with RNaseH-like and TPR domain